MDGSHSLLIRSQQFGTQMPQGGHPPHHSITSSAATSNVCGIARPSAFAVLRLTTSSNFTVCWTGKSSGFSPLSIDPAWRGETRHPPRLTAMPRDRLHGWACKTPGSKIVKRRHEETVGEISRSAENDQAA